MSRLNAGNSQDVKDKLQDGKAVSGLEVLEAAAVEAADGLPAIQVETGPLSLPGLNIPPYDYIALTYVAAGNGQGEIETAVYKSGGSGGTVVATLILAYNGDDEISSVTKA